MKSKIKIPKGYTEEQVTSILYAVANRLASRFKFGYHDVEDIKQQAVLEGWQALPRYNGEHPLENFLWVHVHNRLFNYKRDNYERITTPCTKCPFDAFDRENKTCQKHHIDELEECQFYYLWIMRNAAKRNLVDTINVDNVDDEHESRMMTYNDYAENLDAIQIDRLIQDNLPIKYWKNYDKFKYGASIKKADREELVRVIQQILEENGIDTSNG
jgi:DNA-directed RNA polymerase specialized sigma24 family protein